LSSLHAFGVNGASFRAEIRAENSQRAARASFSTAGRFARRSRDIFFASGDIIFAVAAWFRAADRQPASVPGSAATHA
jgi:hypothetical protein